MTWTLKKETLYADYGKGENEIGYFLPTANEKERIMLKSGDYLMDLIGEFVTAYDEGKTPSKSIFDRMSTIVDMQANYKISWTKTYEGELLNEYNQVIFIFVNPDSVYARTISQLPELYSCSLDLLKILSSTKRVEAKKIYDRIIRDFYDKTH